MRRISKWILFLVGVCLAGTMRAQNPRSEYNILDFGASLDTNIVHTHAINEAIRQCHAQGGGRVVIPAGVFKSGTVFLKDNVELRLEQGAQLVASSRPEDFPIQPKASYRSSKDEGGWAALIYAVGARNIAITGGGIIDGRGKGRPWKSEGRSWRCPMVVRATSCLFRVRM